LDATALAKIAPVAAANATGLSTDVSLSVALRANDPPSHTLVAVHIHDAAAAATVTVVGVSAVTRTARALPREAAARARQFLADEQERFVESCFPMSLLQRAHGLVAGFQRYDVAYRRCIAAVRHRTRLQCESRFLLMDFSIGHFTGLGVGSDVLLERVVVVPHLLQCRRGPQALLNVQDGQPQRALLPVDRHVEHDGRGFSQERARTRMIAGSSALRRARE